MLLERLSRIQRSIVSHAALDEVLDRIITGAAELLGDEVVGLRLIDKDKPGEMVMVASAGIEPELRRTERRGRVGEGIGGRAISEGRLVVLENYGRSPEANPAFASAGVRAAMAAPGPRARRGRRQPRRRDAKARPLLLGARARDAAHLRRARQPRADRRAHRRRRDAPGDARLADRASEPRPDARPPRAGARARGAQRQRRRGPVLRPRHLQDDQRQPRPRGRRRAAGRRRTAPDGLRAPRRHRGALRRRRVRRPARGDLRRATSPTPRQRILDSFEEPFEIRDRDVFVSASIGIALGHDEADDLLRNADLALYRAKSKGKGRYELFQPEMHVAVVERLELEGDLQRALEERRVRARLPADHQAANGRDRGRRGARALAPSRPAAGCCPTTSSRSRRRAA